MARDSSHSKRGMQLYVKPVLHCASSAGRTIEDIFAVACPGIGKGRVSECGNYRS